MLAIYLSISRRPRARNVTFIRRRLRTPREGSLRQRGYCERRKNTAVTNLIQGRHYHCGILLSKTASYFRYVTLTLVACSNRNDGADLSPDHDAALDALLPIGAYPGGGGGGKCAMVGPRPSFIIVNCSQGTRSNGIPGRDVNRGRGCHRCPR